MGIAIIVPNISFADANLGKVTLRDNVPITGLGIIGPSTVSGSINAAKYLPMFTPTNTSQRSVTWSIVSGSSYAIITDSGDLIVLSGADSSSVTIRVTSTIDQTIYADKVISVTYDAGSVTPLYSFAKTYSSLSDDVEDVFHTNVTTNNCIVAMTYNITSHGSVAFLWTMNIGQSPWSGMNIGWNRTVNSGNELWVRNGSQDTAITTLDNSVERIAIKFEPVAGQSYIHMSYTLDGVNWSAAVQVPNFGSSCSIGTGYRIIGSVTADFYNTTDDISFFFD